MGQMHRNKQFLMISKNKIADWTPNLLLFKNETRQILPSGRVLVEWSQSQSKVVLLCVILQSEAIQHAHL